MLESKQLLLMYSVKRTGNVLSSHRKITIRYVTLRYIPSQTYYFEDS